MPSTVSAKIKTYLESTYNKNDVLSLIFLMLACLTKSVANILDLRGGGGGGCWVVENLIIFYYLILRLQFTRRPILACPHAHFWRDKLILGSPDCKLFWKTVIMVFAISLKISIIDGKIANRAVLFSE